MKAFILAAGKGTRMESDLPKVLHLVDGEPMIFKTIENLKPVVKIDDIFVVVGHKADEVRDTISKKFPDIKFFNQELIEGTGQAVKEIISKIELGSDFLVMNGDDSMFYTSEDYQLLLQLHESKKALCTFGIVEDNVDRGYRKVLLNERSEFVKLTQNPSSEGYTVTGLYLFNTAFIREYLIFQQALGDELKITDFLYDVENKDKVIPVILKPSHWFGINTKDQLSAANNRSDV